MATVAGALLTTVLATPAGGASPTAVRAVATTTATAPDSGERRIIRYRVRPGDTATGLAVRYHAWTAELISLNDLGSDGQMHVGQRIRIPVVVDRAGGDRDRDTTAKKKQRSPGKHRSTKRKRQAAEQCRSCRSTQPGRQKVRRVISRTARSHGVDPQLALAISWQESGWRMSPVSSAGAVGAMQVLPTTGVWMSMYSGRPLDIRSLHDNAEAGVRLLQVLRGMTDGRRQLVGAYYQGPGAVAEHGLYRETRPYVRNVLAIKRALERGQQPG